MRNLSTAHSVAPTAHPVHRLSQYGATRSTTRDLSTATPIARPYYPANSTMYDVCTARATARVESMLGQYRASRRRRVGG
eukprot:204068-Rhodomonas_salina.1